MAGNRDNFKEGVKRLLALRVAYRCSNPDCPQITITPKRGEVGVVITGVAAHIAAAAPGGPRYDEKMTPTARASEQNGIWLCATHAHQIDHDEKHFTPELLHTWKRKAIERAFLARSDDSLVTPPPSAEFVEELLGLARQLGLPKEDDYAAVKQRAMAAAQGSLESFRSQPNWPVKSVELELADQLRTDLNFDMPTMARKLTSFREATIVAAPGTGKTTTLLQLAVRLMEGGLLALTVPLSEWGTSSQSLFGWLVEGNSFAGLRAEHLRFLAAHGDVVLMLDGWNELSEQRRTGLIQEIARLRRDFPLIMAVMTTRRQALDVPLSGRTFNLLPLTETQQLEIARAANGERGAAVLDHAWRTEGLRDLTAIPFYLNTVVDLSPEGRLPDTKGQLIEAFIAKHEDAPERREIFDQVLEGHQDMYLRQLAVTATLNANTTIAVETAYTAVTEIGTQLVHRGQLAALHSPRVVVNTLVNAHSLYVDERKDVSFQHQQFQEWYASRYVEARLLAHADDRIALSDPIAFEVLNLTAWEEPLLFACERLSRQGASEAGVVSKVVLACLEIDPMLGASVIARSSPVVWESIASDVIVFADRWHFGKELDRAFAFMVATGRPEFADVIWPLVTDADEQKQSEALSAAGVLRPSSLGERLSSEYENLPVATRARLLSEFAFRRDIEALETAVDLATRDGSSKVKVEVCEALASHRADRHVKTILASASDDVWAELARKGYSEAFDDPEIIDRLRHEVVARTSMTEPHRRFGAIIETTPAEHRSDAIYSFLTDPDLAADGKQLNWDLERAFELEPTAVGRATLFRLENGWSLPSDHRRYLMSLDCVDDGIVPTLALSDSETEKRRIAASAVLGKRTTRGMIDIWTTGINSVHDQHPAAGKGVWQKWRDIEDIIEMTRAQEFMQVLLEFGGETDIRTITNLSRLFSRHGRDPNSTPIQADAPIKAAIADVLERWARVLLSSAEATRHDVNEVAIAMRRVPTLALSDVALEMLDYDLIHWGAARAEHLSRKRGGPIPSDVSLSYSWTYRDLLADIGGATVKQELVRHLDNNLFASDAALALLNIWRRENGIAHESGFVRHWLDFASAKTSRSRRLTSPSETSSEAEEIFAAASRVLDAAGQNSNVRAAELAGIGSMLPHGDKEAMLDRLFHADLNSDALIILQTRTFIGGRLPKAAELLNGIHKLFSGPEHAVWELRQRPWPIKQWLEFFPHCERPEAIFEAFAIAADVISFVPKHESSFLYSIQHATSPAAVNLLRKLAEFDPAFANEHNWYQALLAQHPLAALDTLILVAEGKIADPRSIDRGGHHLSEQLAYSLSQIPDRITAVRERWNAVSTPQATALVAKIMLKMADVRLFLQLVEDAERLLPNVRHSLANGLSNIAYRRDAVSEQSNAYTLVPVDASLLREKLFFLTRSTKPTVAALADDCLNTIDRMRDEGGRVDAEPRHPDISSGYPWPIVK